MNKRFKVSVSDWELVFESGEVIILTTILDESVFISASHRTRIKLNDVTFNSKFIDIFKKDVKLKEVKQTFDLIESDGNKIETIEYNYPSLSIKNIQIISKTDEVSTVRIILG